MKRAKTMCLYTNRTCSVFDEDGEQMGKRQSAIDCYAIDPVIALATTLQASEFYLIKWNTWAHEITRKEMQYLLGVRTLEMDLSEGSRDLPEHSSGATAAGPPRR